MIFSPVGTEIRQCDCGGNMVRMEEISQSAKDECSSSDDTFVCTICGKFEPLNKDVFLDRLDTAVPYV